MTLPSGWRMVTLNELQRDEPRAITDGPFGSNLTSAHYSDSGARVIRLGNIGDGVFIDSPAFIPLTHFEKLRAHEAVAGDLVIASLGDALPRACLVPEGLGPAIVKADCIRIRLGSHVDPRWALYALQRPDVRKWASDQLHGVGRLRLGLKVIRGIPIPLPPIEEQRRIEDTLEDHLSRLDAGVRGLDLVQVEEGLLERALLGAVFDGSLVAGAGTASQTVVPSAPLGECLALLLDHRGQTPGKLGGAFSSEGVQVISAIHIKDGRVKFDERARFVTEEMYVRWMPQPLRAGDVLLTSEAPLGEVAQVPESVPLVLSQRLFGLRGDPGVLLNDYLALLMRSPQVQAQLSQRSSGTTVTGIRQSELRRVSISVPRLDIQRELVQRYSNLRQSVVAASSMRVKSTQRAEVMKVTLLLAAFSGHLIGPARHNQTVEEFRV